MLTVIPVATEQHVVSGKVWTSAELGPVGDEHVLDARIIADDHARRGSHDHAVDGPVSAAQPGEPLERLALGPGHGHERPDDRQNDRAIGHRPGPWKVSTGRRLTPVVDVDGEQRQRQKQQ